MSAGIFFLFLTDFTVVFRIAAIFQAIVAIEEIAITIQISELKSNVKSIWHIREGIWGKGGAYPSGPLQRWVKFHQIPLLHARLI